MKRVFYCYFVSSFINNKVLKKIIVSVTNDLATDQRVDKVCNSLKAEGFNVLLIGRKLKNSPKIKRKYQTKRFKLLFNKGFLFYAEYSIRLFIFLFFRKKDILLANDLDTLPANYLICKLQNKRLVYDSHELFTEVPELINRPKTQKVWLIVEKSILPHLKNNYTVCDSIANYYKNKYNTTFSVIRNVPELQNNTDNKYTFPFKTANKKIIIYQGALNIGRGLELMIETTKHLENCIFVIVGTGDIEKELKKTVAKNKLNNKVKFLGRIPPNELKNITPKADLGISLEEDLGLNYHFALPNKIFDYIHAEIPILASNLPEMKQLVIQYKVGEIAENRTPKELAKQIKNILNKPKNQFKKSLFKAKNNLNWQQESKKLLKLFKNT